MRTFALWSNDNNSELSGVIKDLGFAPVTIDIELLSADNSLEVIRDMTVVDSTSDLSGSGENNNNISGFGLLEMLVSCLFCGFAVRRRVKPQT